MHWLVGLTNLKVRQIVSDKYAILCEIELICTILSFIHSRIYKVTLPRNLQGHYQEGTARPKQLYYKRCAEQLGANAACHAYMYKQKQKHISVCTLQRRTRSRRAVRAKGKPTRIELQWSSLFVTKA